MNSKFFVIGSLAVFAALVVLSTTALHRVTGPIVTAEPSTQPVADAQSPLHFTVKDIDGNDVSLEKYKGSVVLIVNVASKCGFTKQYTGLQALYEKNKDRGLVILGFPANDFKGQEPGSDEEIKAFCTGKYNVTFPMMSKIVVKGEGQAPLYTFLTSKETAGEFAGDIGWNFTKFVVDRSGKLVGRFPSATTPEDPKLVGLIETALGAAPTTQQ
ncbi:MAG: glutathione peroxidase [Tepidisphaeraceae bacterium]